VLWAASWLITKSRDWWWPRGQDRASREFVSRPRGRIRQADICEKVLVGGQQNDEDEDADRTRCFK
jgi:hypothetical protein